MLTRTLTAALVALALAAAVAGCGADNGAGADQGATTETSGETDVSDETFDRAVVVRIEGDREATIRDTMPMRFVVREGEGELRAFSVAHASFPEPVELDGGHHLNLEVGVVGMYDGDGRYTLPAGIGALPTTGPTVEPPGQGPETVSVVGATFVELGDEPAEIRFGYLLEPCTVELADDAREGRAECPALVAVDGSRVSLALRWGAPA